MKEEGQTMKSNSHIHHICRELCICDCYGLFSWRYGTKTEAGSEVKGQEGSYKEVGVCPFSDLGKSRERLPPTLTITTSSHCCQDEFQLWFLDSPNKPTVTQERDQDRSRDKRQVSKLEAWF